MHPGAVGLVEQDGDFTQVHVVRNWCYLGSAASIDEAKQLRTRQLGKTTAGQGILQMIRPTNKTIKTPHLYNVKIEIYIQRYKCLTSTMQSSSLVPPKAGPWPVWRPSKPA